MVDIEYRDYFTKKEKKEFINQAEYYDAIMVIEKYGEIAVQKSKIDDIILFIKEERLAYSDEEGDDMFTNELIERLEDLTKNV